MTLATPTQAAPAQAAPTEATRALASWQVQPGAFLLIGRGQLPAAGTALLAGTTPLRGQFRTIGWPAAAGPAFMAAIRLPDHALAPRGATVALRGKDAAPTLVWPDAEAEAAFGQHAARLAGPHAPRVAQFMLDALKAPPGQEIPAIGTALRAFLSQAAQPDGCIELMAVIPGACVLLQGWGAPLPPKVQVILAGAGAPCFAAEAGEFTRADIAAPACGTILALPPAAAPALAAADHVFVLSPAGLHSRTLVESRVLDPAASLGHLRHLMPSLRGAAPLQALLADALRPRFDGTDTLSRNEHPVRAAFDCVLRADQAGAYLSGWVFDPRRLLAAVHLCDADGLAARIDDAWTRIPRSDVTEAYRGQPGFAPPPDDDAGFAVHVTNAAGQHLHLQFSFADGTRAFMPLTPSDPAEPAVRARLLASIDLHKPSGLAIIERHAAPFLARVRPQRPGPGPVEVVRQGATTPPHALLSVLPDPTPPRALLAGLLHEPLAADERLVLACGPAWTPSALGQLIDLVQLYGIDATILRLDASGPWQAIAAAASAAQTVLLLDPGVTGHTAGWRAALRDAAPDMAWVCPTLLYEDHSVRFAGGARVRLLPAAPYAQLHIPLAGLPTPDPAGPPAACTMGTLACCLFRAPSTLPRPATEFSTGWAREAAFFRAAGAAGLRGAWAPSVQVWAPEAEATAPAPAPTFPLVDGWILRATAVEA